MRSGTMHFSHGRGRCWLHSAYTFSASDRSDSSQLTWSKTGPELRESKSCIKKKKTHWIPNPPAATVVFWGATSETVRRKDPDWCPPAQPSLGWKLTLSSLECAALSRKSGWGWVTTWNTLLNMSLNRILHWWVRVLTYRHPCGGQREQLWVGSMCVCWASSPSAGRKGWVDSLALEWTWSWWFPGAPTHISKSCCPNNCSMNWNTCFSDLKFTLQYDVFTDRTNCSI